MIKLIFCTALVNAVELDNRKRTSDSDLSFRERTNEIDASIEHLLMIEDLSKIKLEKNPEFH